MIGIKRRNVRFWLKADIQIMILGQAPANVRFAPNSGHSEAQE